MGMFDLHPLVRKVCARLSSIAENLIFRPVGQFGLSFAIWALSGFVFVACGSVSDLDRAIDEDS